MAFSGGLGRSGCMSMVTSEVIGNNDKADNCMQ